MIYRHIHNKNVNITHILRKKASVPAETDAKQVLKLFLK